MFFRSFSGYARSCFAVLMLVTGCSELPNGGGGIGGTGQVLPAFGSGLVVGSIDGFGSVIINGQRYTTTNASTSVDGEDADLVDLKAGMTVRARVDHESMTADSLQYQPLLFGSVDTIGVDAMSIAILNQRVLLSDNTKFEGVSREGLRPEMQVEVSGVRTAANTIVASYVRLTFIDDIAVWVGEVNSNNAGIDEAVVAGVTIDYSDFRTALGVTDDEFNSTFLTPGTILRVAVDSDVGATYANTFFATDPIEDTTTVRNLSVVEQLEAAAGEYTELAGVAVSVGEDNAFVTNRSLIKILQRTSLLTASGAVIENLQMVENERVLVSGVVEAECDLVSGGVVCVGGGASFDTVSGSATSVGAEGDASSDENYSSYGVSVTASKVVFLDRP